MKVKKWKMKKNAALALAVILMATGMDFPVYAEETNTAENQVVAENKEATVSPGDGESNEIMMTSLVAEEIHTFAPGQMKEIDGRQYMAGADGARVAWAYDDELYLGYFVSVLEGEVETVIEDSESLCIAYPDGEGGYTNLEKLTIDANGARACVLGEERNFISIKADDVLTREEVYGHETTEVRTYEYFPEQDGESSVRLIFREGKVTIDPDSLLEGVFLDGYLRVTALEGTTDVLEGIDWDDWDDGDGYDTACFGVEGDMILKEGTIVLRSDNSPTIRMKAVATYGITVSGNDMGVNALIQKDDSFAAGLVDGTALISMGPAGEDSFAMYGDPGDPLLVMSDGTVQPASQFSYDENGIYVAYGVFEHVSGNPEVTLYIENDSTPAVTIGNNTEFVAYNIQNRGYIMGSGTLICDEGISTYVIDGGAYKVTGVTMTGYAAFTEEDGVLVAADKSVVSVVSKDDGEKTCTVKVEPDPNPYVIYVGGVGMRNGEYLANGATSSSSSKPASGGYAYIKDNTLTLNNYSYEGPGYLYEPFYDEEEGACYNYTAAIYSDYEAVLNVILEGENSLANTDSLENNCLGHGMAAKGGLNIGGNGSLTIDSSQDGIFTDNEGVTVGGACVLEFFCGDDGICTFCDLKLCENCDVTLNAGDDGLDGAEVEITGNSKLTVYSDSDGIYTVSDITIGGSSKIYIEADSDGIYSEEGNITIGGNSDVYVSVGSDGIETNSSIFISGGCTLKIYADDDGIAGGVQITDTAVIIDAYDDGIDAYDEDIIITNSELIIRNAESGFENTEGDIIIDSSTVDILDVYGGIDCNNTGVTIKGNSTLEICDAQYGVYANKVAISDSTVRVTTDDRAFVVYDSFDIAAGLSVLLPDGGVCGLYEDVSPEFQTILNEDGSPAASVLIAAECDHEYSDYYIYNETHHWKTCTKDCILTRYPEALAEGYAEHDFDDATGKCSCGYEADRDNDLYVGGVGMITGEYLSNEGFISTVKPSGGYAYYKDGTLTLNNYVYSGAGYVYNADDEYMSALYSERDLKIQLEGTNSLKNTSEYCDGITVYNAELTLDGDGTMEIDAGYGIYTYGERDNEDNFVGTDRLIINGGTWNITSEQMAISTDGSVVMTGGTVSADSQWLGISVFEKDFLISGGSLIVNGDEVAVQAAKGITIGEGSKLLAPADGKIVYEENFEDFTGYTIYEADGTTKATHVEIGKAPVEETPKDGDKEDTPGSEGGKGEAIPEPDDDADSDDSSDSEENVNAPAAPVVTPVAPAPAPAQKEQKPAGNEPQQPATGTQQPATGTQGGTETDTTDTGVTETAEEMPFIKGADGKEGWEVIRNEMKAVKSGALITVDMNGATVVPGAVFDDIKGKDVTVAFDLGDGIRWSVNGMDITAGSVKDINLEVKVGADANNTIPVEIINSVSGERECVNVSLSYNGEFGFKATLTLKVDAESAGLFANLFYFNEQTKEMEFICADEIAADGTVELVFTHASEYAIVIDTVSMEAAAGADIPKVVSPAESDSATDGSLWWIVLVLAAVVIAGVVVYVVYSKKRESIEK